MLLGEKKKRVCYKLLKCKLRWSSILPSMGSSNTLSCLTMGREGGGGEGGVYEPYLYLACKIMEFSLLTKNYLFYFSQRQVISGLA